MVSVSEVYPHSKRVTVDLVKGSKSKKAAVLGAGDEVEFDGKKKIVLPVSIDKELYDYWLNARSATAVANELGDDTSDWVGATLKLSVIQGAHPYVQATVLEGPSS